MLTQFSLGPALVGAQVRYSIVLLALLGADNCLLHQPHFHGDAWNALVFGRKQWFLHPPTRSFFARTGVRALDWATQTYAGLCTHETTVSDSELPPPGNEAEWAELRCVQEAGDVIYVPRLWGHAVINLKQSVGAAVEFEQQ